MVADVDVLWWMGVWAVMRWVFVVTFWVCVWVGELAGGGLAGGMVQLMGGCVGVWMGDMMLALWHPSSLSILASRGSSSW